MPAGIALIVISIFGLIRLRRSRKAAASNDATTAEMGQMMADQAGTFPTILTERLRLRQFEPKDDAGLHACLGDENLVRYWDFSACENIQETRRWVRILAKTTSPYKSIAWAVTDKKTDECIGMVNYHHREPRNRRLEIGYILRCGMAWPGLDERSGASVDVALRRQSENAPHRSDHPS